MATDKNKNEVLSVEQRLKSLYELQTILSEIDRIKTIRGELPLEVKDLEDNIEGLRTRIENFHKDVEDFRKKTLVEKEKINEAHEAKSPVTKSSSIMCATTVNLTFFQRKSNSRLSKSSCAKNT